MFTDVKYLAYGSNLNKSQMALRCPDAKPEGWVLLPNYRLVFKGVADIIPDEGACVPVGVWSITDKCEDSLDIYEGYPSLYRKEFFQRNSDDQLMMVYVMNRFSFGPPFKDYLKGIREGYEHFGIDQCYVDEALEYTRSRTVQGLKYIPRRYATQKASSTYTRLNLHSQ